MEDRSKYLIGKKNGSMAGLRAMPHVMNEILKRKPTNVAQSSRLSAPKPREGMVWKVPKAKHS